MHILFLSDNFAPEGNAPATRLFEHAVRWVKKGHKVTVVTCAPNFPEGQVYDGYKNSWYFREEMYGINVVRVKTYIAANKGFNRRILDYLSFMVMGFIAGLFQKKPDVVVATSPQFFAAVGGWALSKVRRAPFIFELRDLWPESAFAVGMIKKNIFYRGVEKLELFLYRQAASVITVTHSFKKNLIKRGINPNKISVVTNGVDLDRYAPTKQKDSDLVQKYNLQDKFVVGYIGTHGLAHALDKVLEAAKNLENEKDIAFLFVGAGAKRDDLVQYADDRNLSNVVLLPRQPKSKLPGLWSLCDVSLIPLRNNPVFQTVIPSKLFEGMGMGLPVIMSLPAGEATQIVKGKGVGVVIPPEDPNKLSEVVMALRNNPELLRRFRNACVKCAPEYSRDHLADNMIQVFKSAINVRSKKIQLSVEANTKSN